MAGQLRAPVNPARVARRALHWATALGAALLLPACGDPDDNVAADVTTATTLATNSTTAASLATSTIISTSAPTTSSTTTSTTVGPTTSMAPTTTAALVTTTTVAGYLNFAVFESGIFQGVGNGVVDIAAFSTFHAIVHAHHDGSGEFSVYTLDENGETMGQIVNSVGKVDGLYPLGWAGLDRMMEEPHNPDVDPMQLDVRADGAWALEIRPLTEIEHWDGTERSGRDSDIVIWSGPESLIEYSVTHNDFLLQIEKDRQAATLASTHLAVIGDAPPTVVGGAGVELIPFLDGIVRVSAVGDGNWTIKTTPRDKYCESITPEMHMTDPDRAKYCPQEIAGGG